MNTQQKPAGGRVAARGVRSSSSPKARSLKDAAIVERLVRGDESAWRQFLSRHDRLIRHVVNHAFRMAGRWPSADEQGDVRATLLLSLWTNNARKLRAFDPTRGVRLSSWIGMLVERCAYDYLRATRSWDTIRLGAVRDLVARSPEPDDLCAAKQAATRLRQAARALPRREREVYRLWVEQDLDAEVVAGQMQTSVQTVYSRRNKIQARLRALLVSAQPANDVTTCAAA